MLRETAARAFAPGETSAVIEQDPAGPETRIQAVNRLFSTLYESLSAAVRALGSSPPSPSPAVRGSGKPPWDRGAGASLTRERALLEGIEFHLETPLFKYRFLNDLGGMITVTEIGAERPSGTATTSREDQREILGAQRTSDGYRLIRKQVSGRKTGFEFTSTRALAELYLRLGGVES